MNSLVEQFSIGETFFAVGKFEEAFDAFSQCTTIMPNIPQPWENMAVCLAAQGCSQNDIIQQVVKKAPNALQNHLQTYIKSLVIQPLISSNQEYITYILEGRFDIAIQKFEGLLRKSKLSDIECISFLHSLFTRQESLAKQQGRMRIEEILNSWVDHPTINHCLEITSKSFQRVIQKNTQVFQANVPSEDFLTVETLGLIHYTYANYQLACIAFEWLLLHCPLEQKAEYQKHLATCYSLAGRYKEAIALDPTNTTAWERFEPFRKEAFVAQALKMHRSAASIQKTYLPYWPEGFVVFRNEEYTLVKLENVSICGQDPMIYDDTFVYAGNRGNYRHAIPQKDNRTLECGMIVFATNSNNYYHLLIEFASKIVAARDILPPNTPIFVSTETVQKHQELLDFLNIPIEVEAFGIMEAVHCKTLYVLDVTHPGHASSLPPNLWDCYLTHTKSIQRLSQQLLQKANINSFCKKPNYFIYVRRNTGVRSFHDPQNKIENLFRSWASEQELQYICFDGTEDFCSQIQIFSKATYIVGIHGAGLCNLLFTPPSCIVFEIPITYKSNTLFLELCAMMERKHVFSDVTCDYLGQIEVDDKTIKTLQQEWTGILEI